jgi:hypothetical protein
VGGDFYTKVGYDKYFGILKIRSEVVSYCVAKCPSCKKLMDVYVNLSKDQKTLAMIWPQLFAKATDTITDSAPHQQDSADFTVGSDSERGKTVGRLSICEKTAIPAEQYAIALYKPRDILSQLSTWKTGLVAVLFSIFVLSIVPLWYQQPHGVTLGRFLRLHLSVILVRGTMLVALFFLLLLRQKYIQLFREMDEFRNLFN